MPPDDSIEAQPARARSSTIKLAIALIAIAIVITLALTIDLQAWLKRALEWIDEQGVVGAVVFFLVYVAATVAFLPGSLLTLGAGAVYGLAKGTALVSVSSIAGASAAFLVGRYLARDWIAKRIEQRPKFKAVDDAVAREGWKIVALTRLSPVFPFNFLNYAFGLTQIGFWPYFFASWLAMLPGTLMYVYIGTAIGNIATLGETERERSAAEWVFFAVGLLATVIVSLYAAKLAKNALARRVEA